MGFEAENRRTGRIDLRGIYRARKDCKFDIIEINNEMEEN